MQLIEAQISNFRSIKDVSISFRSRCRILGGINESGKSNILAALNLLDPNQPPIRRDVREPGLREDPIKEARVRFIFEPTASEVSSMVDGFKSKILANDYGKPFARNDEKEYTIEEFCESRQGLYSIDILTGARRTSSWSLSTFKISNDWKRVSAKCPAEFAVGGSGTSQAKLKEFIFVESSQFPDIPAEYLESATSEDVWAILKTVIFPMIELSLPKVRYWKYDESKLLPPRIDLDQFCANPDICIPLRRMFQLYEIQDIKKDITDAKTGSANGLPNLLRRVADKTSAYFHKTWREYDGIKFSLTMDGTSLVAAIEDVSNHYELSQRSDGFKRFVSFLLTVSAEDEREILKNSLLLIDEPESGLHPTGARYLMEELVDISRNNYVVFSTHSIFMIDNKNIQRHIITKKINEITETAEASESNIQDEEVIYKSLGYSIFASLKEKNLIFEGWRDKELFETALTRVPSAHAAVKELKNLGHCFVKGVKQIEGITPLFEAGSRKCLILSDSDATAREHQRHYQEEKGYGVWKRFDELLEGTTAITGEDFIKEEAFKAPIEALSLRRGIAAFPINNLATGRGKIATLRRWLNEAGIPSDGIPSLVDSVKEAVFSNLRSADIKAEYYEYLEGVLGAVQNL